MAELLLAHGSYDSKAKQEGAEYDTISWPSIARMVKEPQSIEKAKAAFIIPSTYSKHDGRSHEVQRQHGAFYALAIDVDDGNPTKDDLIASVRGILGNVSLLCYTSQGATQENKKWRVLIPIKEPISGDDYSEYQVAMFEELEERGIKPDYVLARTGQPIYLPNVPAEKRDENGSPLFYDFTVDRGDDYLTLTDDHPVVQRATSNRAHRMRIEAEAKLEREKRQAERERRREQNPDQVSPIDEFNARHSVEAMLDRYGYTKLGASDQWKSPNQSTKSFAVKNFGEYWVSMSGSDVSAGVGNKKGTEKAAYCWGDAFSLYMFYEHGNDLTAAVRAYGAEINPSDAEHDPFAGIEPVASAQPPEPDEYDLDADFDTVPQQEVQADSLIARTVFTPPQAKPILTSNYLVKNWLGKGQMSVVYAPSNAGKSFMLLDMAWCVAANVPWHGNKVDGGPVLYLATEGGMTFHNRIYALAQKYGNPDIPLYIRPAPVDLLDPKADMREIAMLCREIEQEASQAPSLIIVDTLSRAIAGGNENGPEDMTKFINNLDKLRDFVKAHISVVHHSGKDVAAGARGHSSLRAATDTEVEVTSDPDTGIRIAKATKQRDLETGTEFAFRLNVIDLGKDQDGDVVTTVVVEQVSESEMQEANKPKLKGHPKHVMNCFWQLKGEGEGEFNPAGAGWGESGSYWVIGLDRLREHFTGQLTIANNSRRSAWKRAIEFLQANDFVHVNDSKIAVLIREDDLSDFD